MWRFGRRLTAETELTAGIARETAAAVNASGTTLSADASKTTIGLGAIHDVAGWGRLTISYAHVFVNEARVYAANPSSGVLDGKLGGRMDALGSLVHTLVNPSCGCPSRNARHVAVACGGSDAPDMAILRRYRLAR